jgi:dipeptidyl aminopeptidase/acylaminoacyl peptidase
MLFPADIAQNEGTFKPIAMEVVDYKLTLVVEWTYIANSQPSYRAWVDVATGVFLRYQQFEKSGGATVLSETIFTRVDYDLSFPSDLFSPAVSAMPEFVSDPLVVVAVTPTPAAFVDKDPLGMVYAFVTDNGYPVRATRLVRLPGSCAVGLSDCPEAEVIETPVPLDYSLSPLVWSPTRQLAAWSYSNNTDYNIWGLYFFDARAGTWKMMAEFNRSIDPPMWSRDGTWIAFRVQGDGQEAIFAMRADGSGLRELTATDKLPAEGKPYVMDSWLGENVILRSAKPGATGTIYLMRVEDGFVKPLFETLLTKASFIESPDGTLLAYVDYDYTNQKQVVKIITPDGNTLRELTTFVNGSVQELTWSSDGKQLAFVHRTDTASSVYVIDSDGRNLRQAFMNTTDTHFVFSPDGKYLLIQTIDGTGEHLYAVNLSTLVARLVQAPGVALNEGWMWPTWKK